MVIENLYIYQNSMSTNDGSLFNLKIQLRLNLFAVRLADLLTWPPLVAQLMATVPIKHIIFM